MFFPHKKKLYLTVSQDETIFYDGLWANLPFAEEIILKKSVEFFDDPEPCVIHRDAVHMRLLTELETLLPQNRAQLPPEFCTLFFAYTRFPADCLISFSEK